MHQYKIYLMRVESTALFQEASIELSHQIAPQFKLGEKTLLTEGQAKALFQMVGDALAGDPVKIDLKTFAPMEASIPLTEETEHCAS